MREEKSSIPSKGGMTYQMQDEEGRGEEEMEKMEMGARWGEKVEWSNP